MINEEAKKIIIKERDSLKANPMVEVEDCLYEAFDMAIEALKRRPTGKWIPCEERLPEPNRLVLCYITTGASKTYFLAFWNANQNAWEEGIGGSRLLKNDLGYEAIAWMPLPKWEGMEYDEERNTITIKKSAYDDAVERIEKSTFTLHDGLDCVETLVALEAVMIASGQTKSCEEQYSVDCVSRDAVLKLADYFGEPATYDNPMPDGIMAVPVDKIEELPSVIPTNPSTTSSVGVWIDQGLYADNSSAHDFMCSVCGNHEIEVEMDHFKYCPVCGARLEAEE